MGADVNYVTVFLSGNRNTQISNGLCSLKAVSTELYDNSFMTFLHIPFCHLFMNQSEL